MESNLPIGSLLNSPSSSSAGGIGDLLRETNQPKLTYGEEPRQVTDQPVGKNVDEFVRSVAPAAQRVAKQLNVPVEAVIGQWGLETGWGRSVIPGTNNLGNIKSTNGQGVAATDNMTGSRDKYRQYASLDDFADDFSRLVGTGRYRGVAGTADAQSYFQGLKSGGYAEDPNYVASGTKAAAMAAEALKRSGMPEEKLPKADLPDLTKIPKWGQIESGKKYQSLDDAGKQALKARYFDEVIAPHAQAAGANVEQERQKFLAKQPGLMDKAWEATKDIGSRMMNAFEPEKSVMEGFKDAGTPQPLENDASKIPVKPEVRAAFNAQWDKATPAQRATMAGREDWVGALAREKGERAQRLDQQIAAVSPQDGDAVTNPVNATEERMLRGSDTRAEARESRLLALGYDKDTAKALAKLTAGSGVKPGMEDKYAGSVKESDFDFDTKAMFDPSQPANGLNNPLSRGVARAVIGTGKTLVGFDQFLADFAGAEVVAKGMRGYGDALRGKEEAIGERGNFLERNLEGAINSIAQQLPLMVAGVKLGSEALPLAGMAVETFGQEYSDGRAKGQTPGEAATRASIFAAFDVIGEKLGIKGNMEAMRAAAAGKPTEALVGFLSNMVKKEVPGELLTTTGQFGTDKLGGGIGLNQNAGLDEYLKQVADTIAQTIMQGGLMGAAGGGVGNAVKFLNQAHMPEDIFARELQASVNDTQWNRQAIDEQVVRSMNANGTITMPAPGGATATTDGRIEPSFGPAPTPDVATPAQEAGAPAINPPTSSGVQPAAPAAAEATALPSGEVGTDADVIEFAQARFDALQTKLLGEDDSPDATGTLTPAEQDELNQLTAAGEDPAKLRKIYGFTQSKENGNAQAQEQGQATGPALDQGAGIDAGNPAAWLVGNQPGAAAGGAQVGAEAGQRHEGVPAQGALTPEHEAAITGWLDAIGEADQEVRQSVLRQAATDPAALDAFLSQAEAVGERQAIQYDGQVEEGDGYAIPQPEELAAMDGQAEPEAKEQPNVTQAAEAPVPAVQEEARQEPGVPEQQQQQVAPPKTEKEAKARKAAKEPRRLNSEGRAEDGKPIMPGDVFLTSSGRTTTPYPSQKSEKFASQWLIDNAIEEAKARGDDFNATVFSGEKPAAKGGALPPASIASMQEYLFGQQPAVVPSILKPLSGGQQDSAPAPKTEKEAKAQREESAQPAGAAGEGAGESKPTQVSTNTVFTEEAAAKARERLRKKLGQLNSGIDPEMMMDGITLAGYHIEKGARTFSAYAKAMLADLGDAVRPYLKSWYMGVRFDPRAAGFDGMDDAATVEAADLDTIGEEKPVAQEPVAAATDLHTPEGKFKVAQTLADEFIGGASFATIVEARKRIGELIGKKIEPATELAKQADEAIEVAVVLAGREMIEAGRKQGRSPQVIFDRLVSLYNAQPNLAVRSSTSVRDQAYSTPVPLAFVASELAGITAKTKVLEPTAGNGMLLIGASPKNSTANELNPKRAAMLNAMGMQATTENAANGRLVMEKSQDAVIANPPFGATKDDQGNTIIYEVKPNYGTREVDHAIAFKALESMKDDGRAVLIVGGSNATSEEGRREDYRGKSKRSFYFSLYNDYNVVDHFTIDGSMYSKQGASYPVDVIVIQGRGKSSRDLPAADLPKVIGSYEELKEKLNGTGSVDSQGDRSPAGDAGREDKAGSSGKDGVVGSSVGSDQRPGSEGGRAGNDAGVQDAGRTGTGESAGSGTVLGGKQSEPADAGQSGDSRKPVSGDSGRAKPGSQGRTKPGSDGLGGTSVVSGERVESGLTDRRGNEQETENQVAYAPHSQASSVGTLVPKAMRDSIEASLQKLEDQVGNLDEYVAERLEMDPDDVRTNFSAEQVDALALSIKNAEEGRGFIIGDQTGIGKGRVVAAMIRYALVNGKVPIFVTEKPNLYSDMIRDLDDIGMTDELGLDTKKPKILITNGGESIPYTLLREVDGEITENNLTLRAPKSGKALDDLFKSMMAGDSLGEYKVIFTTYSQVQTINGKVTDRMKFVKHFGAGNYMIFDESHNAGGAGETQARTKEQRDAAKNGDSLVTGRAAFVRQLVSGAYGTFFSSATYAKRPDVMDLYSSTNMKLAVDRISQLADAIKRGGVPMQQITANMLTIDGQYIRRERTFAGVAYDTVETPVDKQTAENMAYAMRRILNFSRAKEKAIKAIQKEMDREGAMVREMGGEKSTIQGANFGSTMHNLIDQMLLSLKAKSSVDHAIKRLQAGEKVVLTVSNTMGSFIEKYAKDTGINIGDPVALSFTDLYKAYLERQRWVTIKDGNGNKTQRRLTDEELGAELVRMFSEINQEISKAGFGNAPISPIDYMHAELRKAGYKTDEITGRDVVIDYSGAHPKLSRRSSDIKQRLAAISGFNNGTTDALILNQSGSTGLSLHSNSKFKDKRKRHMIIVQAEKNIDTHMQMLGRVHRTGQVIAPSYSQMMADVPAEMRPAAVLLKKMASLNANTTASRKSAVTADGVVDFMNDYGGQVVQEFLRDNPDLYNELDLSKRIPLLESSDEATEDDIRSFTGYIPLLPIKQQEEIYKELIERYNELLERENSMGTNKLEAKAVDLDAKTILSMQITEDKGDPSIFASPAYMEKVDVKRTVKPYSSKEVLDMIDERLGSKTADEVSSEQIKDLKERASKYAQDTIAKMEAAEEDQIKIEQRKNLLNMIYGNTKAVLDTYSIGDSIVLKDKLGMMVYGVITDITAAKRTANPAAGSDWKMHIALANGDAKSLTITFSQIGSKYELSKENSVNWYNPETQQAEYISLISVFDKGSTARREKRWIVTGNILAGYAKYPGQIITFTKKDGTTAQGVLMSRQFDFEKEQKNQPVNLKSGLNAVKFIEQYGGTVGTQDGTLKVSMQRGNFVFTVPSSKKDGGTYYLDKGITDFTGDFYKRGGVMTASLRYAGDAAQTLDYIINGRGEPIYALTHAEKAREMMGDSGPKFKDIGRSIKDLPEKKRVNLKGKIARLNKQVEEGKITDAEFRLAVNQAMQQLKEIEEDKKVEAYSKGRRNGADWIISKLRRGVADGTIPRGEADFAQWALEQNPHLADRLTISVTEKDSEDARGQYFPGLQMIKLYANNLDEDGGTVVHEILHHAERMLPIEVQEGILAEWQKQWDKAYKEATPAVKKAMRDMLEAAFGSNEAAKRVTKAFDDGTLNYDKHYQFFSPSEFWTVNATRILSNRYQASGSWVSKAIQWFKEFIQKLRGMLGLRSDATIIKALKDVMATDGNPKSAKMIQDRDYSMWLADKEVQFDQEDAAEPQFRNIIGKVQRDAMQFFGNQQPSLRTFGGAKFTPGWFVNGLSTQFHKALKDEHYGKVFAYVNAMQNEVSLTSIRPAELAPGILHKVDDFKSAAKTLFAGKETSKSMKGATSALIAGTLHGKNVLEGKVWTEEELRNNFGLDDAGVSLYHQARAAIDASLDEAAAAECYSLAQGFVAKNARRKIIDDPKRANNVIFGALHKAKKLLEISLENAKAQQASQERIEYLEATIKAYDDTEEKIKAVLAKVRELKAAGYMPLMRFGEYTVTVERIDPMTGNLERDDNGEAVIEYFGTFETQAEAKAKLAKMQGIYGNDPSVRVVAGVKSNKGHELYEGISPETLALFAEAVGADKVLKQYYKDAISERSALKRRLERKGTAGYSEDLPRILANFITSNGRYAAQRYYLRDLTNAIKFIPKQKGDVRDEAIELRKHTMQPNDPAAPVSAALFAWFLGGSVASAAINLTQPVMMTTPYLAQFGPGKAVAAVTKAIPMALGKKEIADKHLKAALKRASQEGIVEAQEIFHLYTQGAQGVSAALARTLSRLPVVGDKLKESTEGLRARSEAFFTLWGMMFSAAESFNRKLTFLAAWDVAIQNKEANPYAFAVRAVNETQGIYNKANRPNWARGPVGRVVLTFKQFSIMYVELLSRMWKKGGPEGKRAAMLMLAMLMLAAGEEGLPGMSDLDDLIDTIGQMMGYDTNMKRNKRRVAYEILGKQAGDLFLYGASSMLPLDFSGRLGMGNLIPGTGLLKQSAEGNKMREVTEVIGPAGSLLQQINDAYESATAGNSRKALENLAPKAVKDAMAGTKMATAGYATDTKGRKNMDVTLADAAIKAVGFNPTKIAEASRARGPIMQDRALQKNVESAIVDTWARGIALKDEDLKQQARKKMTDWNKANPDNPVRITTEQLQSAARQYRLDQNTRIIKSAPKEIRGRAASELGL